MGLLPWCPGAPANPMTRSFTARQACISATFSVQMQAAWMFVDQDGRNAVCRRGIRGQPSQSIRNRFPVARRTVEIVELLLERGELLFELRCDQNRQVFLAVIGRYVPFDSGEDEHVRSPGSCFLNRVEVLSCRRLEIEIAVISNGDRVASIDRRPVENLVDGPRAIGERRMRMCIDLQPHPGAGPGHFPDEMCSTRLFAHGSERQRGDADNREYLDRAALRHGISQLADIPDDPRVCFAVTGAAT